MGNRSIKTDVRGRDMVSGLPRSLEVSTEMILEATNEPLWIIIQGIRQVLEKTPPELAGDIYDKGIVVTGGGALLDGLSRVIAEQTGVPVYLADDPIASVALGTGKALDVLDRISGTLISTRTISAAL